MTIGQQLANAAIIELARQLGCAIGSTGDDDYTDLDDGTVITTINRSELADALALALTKSTPPT